MKTRLGWAVLLITTGACGVDDLGDAAEDQRDATFQSTGGVVEGSADALAILELVNTATLEVLDAPAEVGLSSRAAANIVAHRVGRDRVAGTADDNPFDTLLELDRVPYVGALAFSQLLAYVHAHPPAPVCDAADLDAYVAGLPGFYAGAMPASICVAPQRVIAGYDIDVCDQQTCADGSTGCAVAITYSDVAVAALDPATLATSLAARAVSTGAIGIRATVGGRPVFSCTAQPVATSVITTPLTAVPDPATTTIATTAAPGTSTTTVTTSGCGEVAWLADVIANQIAGQLDTTLAAGSQQTLAAYATTCE